MPIEEAGIRITGEQTITGPAAEARAQLELLRQALAHLQRQASTPVREVAISELTNRISALGVQATATGAALQGTFERSRVGYASIGAEIDRTTRAGERLVSTLASMPITSPFGQVSTRDLDAVATSINRTANSAAQVGHGFGIAFGEGSRVAQRELDLVRRNVQEAYTPPAATTTTNVSVLRAVSAANQAEMTRIQAAQQRAAGAAAVTWKVASAESIDAMLGIGRAAAMTEEQVNQSFRRRSPGIDFQGMFANLNRQGALEAQAAVVNSVQALASGMSPLHVAIMESAQLAGAAIQGGLVSLRQIFTAIVSPIGMAVAGVTGLAAALGTVAYKAYQAESAMKGLYNAALLQGRPAVTVESNADAQMRAMMGRGVIGRDEARTGAIAVQRIPNISGQAREALGQAFEGFSKTQFGDDAEKAAAALEKIFGSTPSMKSFVDENNLLTGELKEQFDAAVAIGDGFTASTLAARGLQETVKGVSDAVKAVREEAGKGLLGWLRTHDIFGRPQAPDPAAVDAELAKRLGTGSFQQIRFPEGRTGPTEPEVKANQASEATLRAEREILGLLERRKQLIEGIAVTQNETDRARSTQALRENERQLAESHTPLREEGHQLQMAFIEAEIQKTEQAAEKDIALHQRVVDLRRQQAEAIAAFEQGALEKVEGATHRTTAAEVAAHQRVADARRAAAVAALEERLFESGYRAAQAPTDPRVALAEAQRRLNDLTRDEAANRGQIRDVLTQIVGLQKQVADYARDAVQAAIQQQEALAQGRGDLAAVVELRRQEQALVEANVHATPAERVRAQSGVLQAQQQAQQQSIQLQQQAAEAANGYAAQRLQTVTSALGLEVTQYNITRAQALQAEQGLTSRVMAEQQGRVAALLEIDGLQPAQRAQINNELATLYEQDAQRQIDLQRQITEEIRKENERRTEYFKNFFKSVETASSDLLIAGVTRSQTRNEALQSAARSIGTSLIREMGNMGSQYAGKGLADVLGVKVDPTGDTSISSVLAKSVGQMLGLTKPEPKFDQAAVTEKMGLAAEAHQKAAAELSSAAAALTKLANEAPYRGGRDPDLSPSGLGPSRITPRGAPAASSSFDSGAAGEYGVAQPVKDLAAKVNDNSQAVAQLTQVMRQEKTGALPEGSAKNFAEAHGFSETSTEFRAATTMSGVSAASNVTSGLQQLSGAVGNVIPGFRVLSGAIGTVQGVFGGLRTLTSGFQTAKDAVTVASTAEQVLTGAKVVGQAVESSHTGAVAVDTAATQAHSAAQATSSGGSIIGGVLKAIPFIGGFFERGGIVSAAGGMVNDGRGGRLAVLHPREMVLPARISEGVQRMIDSGAPPSSTSSSVTNAPVFNYNSNVTGYHPYSSRSGFESMLRTHGGAMRAWVENMARNRAFG